ncbi:MAG: protein kinase [Candidatus Hydrogenedentota bacterium]
MDKLIKVLEPVLRIAEIPLGLAGIAPIGWVRLVNLALVLFVIYLFLKWCYRKLRFKSGSTALADSADIDALLSKDTNFNDTQHALGLLKANSDQLKKGKQWDQLGKLYAEANSPADAAQYYLKAKMYKEAGMQLAQTGKSAQAAKLLQKAGDYETAGLFYMQHMKFAKAAKAFVKGGHSALAADAYVQAKKPKLAVEQFINYFSGPRNSQELQLQAAESCLSLLRDEKLGKNVTDDDRLVLSAYVAGVLEHAKRFMEAAELFREAGDVSRAGEIYVMAGDFEKAAVCMKAAGREKDASLLSGRFFEKQEQWKEAAMAYAGGGEYEKSADCFVKCNEPVRAGEFYEKAGAFTRAGHSYAAAKRFDKAIEALQKVPETDKNFDFSRGILGRCFYEMHDYAHSAATLDNHLLNQRIDQKNMDYFYMLALAWEQLGQLKKSKDLLLKISSVSAKYRDLDTRISSIDSRISIIESESGMHSRVMHNTPGPDAMNMVANTLKERYDIQTELGRGGMGVVYRARDKQLDRQVALKFLGNLVDNSDEYRKRFIREAQTAAKITHPNIVAIFDISASDGKAYIAMEYVEGDNLYQYVQKKGVLGPRDAIAIMGQACSALGAIHAVGIVHRDIKPDNIVVASDGIVKLMDFGLAKADTNRITQANMIMGTPSCMSPELATGKEVDGRTDIYAMGLVLYEMMTGKVVFADGDVMQRQVKEMPPRLDELVPGIPVGLADLAYKCIQKDPNARYQTAAEVIDALKAVQLA